MPRDYAKNSSRESKKPGQLPGWIWMMGGLAIGLFVAFVVYLNDVGKSRNGGNIATVIKETFTDLQENAEQRKEQQQAETKKQATTKTQTARAETETEKPKPSFDFYYILPELEVAVPEQELARQSQQSQNNKSAQEEKIDYILQAGSFRSHDQADQLKASLALKGITANIQTVNVNSVTWHRVRIGPITSMSKLTQTRKRLRDSGIQAIVVKNRT